MARRSKPKPSFLLTLEQAASEFHVSRETVKKRLRAAEIEYSPGDRLSIFHVHTAVVGDLHQEKIRLTRAQADIAELEKRKTEGELVTMDEAKSVLSDTLVQIRTELMAMASSIAQACNPANPEQARAVIHAKVSEVLRRSSK